MTDARPTAESMSESDPPIAAPEKGDPDIGEVGPGESGIDDDPGPVAEPGEPAVPGTGTDEAPVAEPGAESEDAESDADPEGPRRRARRERAERRAAQQRATTIEHARREAKRRIRGETIEEPKRLAARTVKGLQLVVWLILLTVASVILGLVLYFTPVMSARSVVVIGTGLVTRDEVIDVAQVRLGTPLLQIDTDVVADRVASIRRVASARVQREYPSELRITIVERVPVVLKDFSDGPHLFDRDGVDFATAPPPPGLPYIDVDNPGPTDPPTLAALEVMTALRPEVVAQVGRIAAPSVAAITLTLADGRTVVWGTTDRTDEKAEKLAALLTQPGRVYDVSSPDLPTVK